MEEALARRRFAGARVARLATAGGNGVPHLVPVTFALDGDRILLAVDHKPKTTTDLRRIRDIRENPRVCALVDHYDDDWATLWWVRADGEATVTEGPAGPAVALLAAKYPQYGERPPAGPMITIEITRWSSWSYSGD
ncbi:TIGR03668 family PPOX class F420-dependent oxidoreductase [Streptosporangium sp. KLBMP 9127]|nr:TIGR03668 family PPOX class F420-dependent oxidoreductase [Streptosporangium sp. KLBMP 9127]